MVRTVQKHTPLKERLEQAINLTDFPHRGHDLVCLYAITLFFFTETVSSLIIAGDLLGLHV